MSRIKSLDKKTRFFVCFALFAFSLLLLGAGQVTGELNKRNEDKKLERDTWKEVVVDMSGEMPREFRDEWKKAASENPQLFLKISTAEFNVCGE